MSGDWFRILDDAAEGVGVHVAHALFSLLPLDAASDLGGWIGRRLGRFFPGTKRASANLAFAMPELSEAERRRIIDGMWDNLGRTMAEYPHLARIAAERVDVVGLERFRAIAEDGKSGFIVSGHIANWEVGFMMPRALGVDVALVFRVPNNPHSAKLLERLREGVSTTRLPKGSNGAREMLKAIGEGKHVLMLLDQRLTNGVVVPFFGRPAATPSAAASLAIRRGLPFQPYRLERLGGARFRLTIPPPMTAADSGDRDADVAELMTRFNAMVEGWIRERPEQWLWQHRRWAVQPPTS